jgi:hypothetical protein
MPGNGNPQKQFSGSKQPISEPGKKTSMNTKESLPRRDSFKKHREGQFQPSYRGQKSVGLLRSTVRPRVPPTEFSKHRLRFPTLRACLKVSCLSEAVEHKACCDECLRALHAVLVILAQSAIAAKPSEAALDNPCKACHLERALPAFDDLQLPAVLTQQVVRELAALVSGISNDCADVRE